MTQTGMGVDADGHFVEAKCTFLFVEHTWTQTQTDVVLGADGHFFGSGNIHGLRRRRAWMRRRRDMDADADARRGASWASSRAFRPMLAPHQHGGFARDICPF